MSKRALYKTTGVVFYFCFFALLFLLPLFRGAVYPVERVLFTFCFFLLYFLWEFRCWIKAGTFFTSWKGNDFFLYFPLFLLIVLWMQTLCFSAKPFDSLVRLWDFTSFFFIYLIGRFAFQRDSRKRQLFIALSLIGGFYALLGLGYYFDLLIHPWWEKAEFLSGTFVNHNHFAGFMELMLFFLLGRLLAQRSTNLLPLLLLFLVTWSVFLLSLSRGGWVSFFVTLFIAAMLLIGDKSLRQVGLRILAGMLLILGVFLVYVFSGYHPEVTKRFSTFFQQQGQHEFFDFRVRLWRSTCRAIAAKPLSGYGLGSFDWEMRQFREKGFPYKFDYAHNDWLQFFMEMGGILFLLVLFFLLKVFSRLYQNFRSVKLYYFRFEEFGLFLAIFCVLVHSLVDFNLHIYGNTVYFVLFLSLLLSPSRVSGVVEK